MKHVTGWSYLREWIYQNNCSASRITPKKLLTHLLFSGGRLIVPDNKVDEFHRAIVKSAFVNQDWIYVTERFTHPLGKLGIEIDLYMPAAMSVDEIVSRIGIPLQNVMMAAFPDVFPRMVICKAPDQTEPSNHKSSLKSSAAAAAEVPCYKTGIHAIWPDIRLDKETAWFIRAWFILELSHKEPEIDWDEALDPAQFFKSLRMIWSRKAVVCPACDGKSKQILIEERQMRTNSKRKVDDSPHQQSSIADYITPDPSSSLAAERKKRQLAAEQEEAEQMAERTKIRNRVDVHPCDMCKCEGKLDLGRPYDVCAVVSIRKDGDAFTAFADPEVFSALMRDPLSMLNSTSIRVIGDAEASPFVKPADEILLLQIEGIVAVNKKLQRYKKSDDLDLAATGLLPARCNPQSGDVVFDELSDKEPVYLTIERFTKGHLGAAVRSIKTTPNKTFYLVNTDRKDCANKGGPHSSSTVYYIFYPDGYVQKCWSRKGTIYHRGDGPCSDYRSPLYPYDAEMAKEMQKFFSKRQLMLFRPPQQKPPKQPRRGPAEGTKKSETVDICAVNMENSCKEDETSVSTLFVSSEKSVLSAPSFSEGLARINNIAAGRLLRRSGSTRLTSPSPTFSPVPSSASVPPPPPPPPSPTSAQN